MSFIFPLTYIILFNYSLSIFIKKSFERLLPFTFIISACLLFISQFLFKTFYVGFIICILFTLIFPIKLFLKKEKLSDIKDKYITKGLIAFIILYLIVFIFDFNRFFTRWDELSHWGKMVKEMIKLDSFYSVENSNLLVHKDYPPIMSLMELFFSLISGGYKECYLIRCMHLFEGSIIISCLPFNKCNNKEVAFKTIISIIVIYLITFLLDTVIVINSIYTDYVLSLFVGYTLFNIFKEKEKNIDDMILLILSCVFILLLKQISIAFYLMIIFLFILISFINKKDYKKALVTFILIIIIPILFLSIWNNYIDSLGIKGQFEVSDIKINDLLNQNLKPWQKETISNYANAIFDKSILNSKINISYFQFIIIILFLSILLFLSIKDKKEKNKVIALASTLLIGFIGYAILMLLLYIYSFGELEGPVLASYDRYMSSYVLVCLYSLIFIYINVNDIKLKNIKNYIVFIFILCLMIKPSSYLRLRPDLIILDNHFYDKYRNASEKIDLVAKDMDKVYIIDQNERDGAMYYINYFSNKVRLNNINYFLPVDDSITEELFYTYYYGHMKDFDYLYTYDIDEKFIEKYEFLSSKKLKENRVYKIILKNKKIYLEEIK